MRQFFATLVFLLFVLQPALGFGESLKKLKVGVVLALTGSMAEYGAAQRKALELARQEHPEYFARVEYVIEDNGYTGAMATTAFQKLRMQDKVDLIYVWGVEPVLAVAPIAERSEMPLLASSQVLRKLDNPQFVIRALTPIEDYAEKFWQYFRRENIRRIGILKTEISIYNALVEALQLTAVAGEQVEEVATILPNDVDLRTTVVTLKQRQFDAVGLFLLPPQLLEYFKVADNVHYQSRIFGFTPFESRTLREKTGGKTIGAVYAYQDASQNFRERYIKAFGDDTQLFYAANMYDTIALLARLMEGRNVPPHGKTLVQEIYKTASGDGASGHFVVRQTKDKGYYFDYPVVLKEVATSDFPVVFR